MPAVIIFGFALIAAAIYVSNSQQTPTTSQAPTTPTERTQAQGTIRPIDSSDYIRGNPNAPIMLVEYSDYDCQFCKQYHDTMRMIMDDYGATGRVAWVYRQFPVEQLHPNAPRISEAALCTGELGGAPAFWTFTDLIFDERDPSQATNMTRLPEFAQTAGVSLADYTDCMSSGRQRAVVQASVDEAFAIGADGTPYTILLVGNQQAVISGAQPYAVVRNTIESLLRQIDGAPVE